MRLSVRTHYIDLHFDDLFCGSDVRVFWGEGNGGCLCVVRSIMQHHSQRILMNEFLAQTCLCSGVRGMEAVCVLSVPSCSTIVSAF